MKERIDKIPKDPDEAEMMELPMVAEALRLGAEIILTDPIPEAQGKLN